MNKKYLIVAWVMVMFFVVLQLTPFCFSQAKNIYHNPEGHFSFVVPEGWAEFSKDTLSEFVKAMNQLPGARAELTSGFYDTKKTSTYMLLQIKKSGRWSESKLQKLISDRTVKQAVQDRAKIFRDFGKVKYNEFIYDDKKHILYMKVEMSKDTNQISGVAATILSNYGSVQIAFYSLKEDFDTALNYLNQIIDSFNFDEGYQYSNGQEESKDKMGILPKSLPSLVLLCMSIFLYGRYVNWRKLKETQSYLIKSIIVLVFAVILNRLFVSLYSSDLSRGFLDTLEIILTIGVGVIWYKEYKKIKNRDPFPKLRSKENS